MFYNLKIILRSLRHNLAYSVINIAGLSIGITASVFIFLWVYNERSYDRYHPDADRIYRIVNTYDIGGGSLYTIEDSPLRIASLLEEFPEVEKTAVAYPDAIFGIKVRDELFPVRGNIAYIDSRWFELFDYQLLEGSFFAFSAHPNSVALTASEARKYFGNSSAIGQTIGIDEVDYTVQAVVRNNPANSSFQWNILVSKETFLSPNRAAREEWFQWHLFAKLRQDADISGICVKIKDFYPKMGYSFKIEASLKPLTGLHFETDIPNSKYVSGNSKAVSLFSLLGILLLLTACINYVNLATAKANVRAKEVGVRKIVGAKRGTLFTQFISESFVICIIAMLTSLILIGMLSPFYRLLVENAVLPFSSPIIWVILGAILLVTTLLNGIYPALTLSSFRPMNFLKGVSIMQIKGGTIRRGLVVFQFTLSTILIISVMVIYKQMKYIQQMNPGYNREQVISLQSPYDLTFGSKDARSRSLITLQTMKKELQAQACIAGVTLHNADIANVIFSFDHPNRDDQAESFHSRIAIMGVDADYMQTLGLELVEGRWFEEGVADEKDIILNETAIRELKIPKPVI